MRGEITTEQLLRPLLSRRLPTSPLFLLPVVATRGHFTASSAGMSPSRRFMSSSNRPRDIDDFLSFYPGQTSSGGSANLEFYSGKWKMRPENMTFDEFLRAYETDWDELELNQSVLVASLAIYRLFPIREQGLNHMAQPLTTQEIEAMSSDTRILQRQIRAYATMLRFYGIDFNDGYLARSGEWESRFRNLSQRPHNLLRLTRMLKHLSEFPQLQPHAAPLVLFFTAQHSEGRLDFSEGTMACGSLERWWGNCFRDEGERRAVRDIVMARGARGEGKWGGAEWDTWMKSNRPHLVREESTTGTKPE